MWWKTLTKPSGSVIYHHLHKPFKESPFLRWLYKSENNVPEQTSAEQKIKSMVECKDFRKGIIQLQWVHKKKQMKMEDLINKSRDIRRLKLTEEQRDVRTVRLL